MSLTGKPAAVQEKEKQVREEEDERSEVRTSRRGEDDERSEVRIGEEKGKTSEERRSGGLR